MMQCPWTFREFCLGVFGAIFLVVSALYVARNIDTSLRNGRGYSQEGIDTRLTDCNCWEWSTQYPVDSFNSCQNQFLGVLGGEK